MANRIEDHALLGDTHTAALVARDGSIDWWCPHRFDSAACFAAILGTDEHGHFRLAPVSAPTRTTRAYRAGSLVLETTVETATGSVRIVDALPIGDEVSDLVRIVEGVSGTVEMALDLVVRFDHGSAIPWVTTCDDGGLRFVAGPDALKLTSPVPVRSEDQRVRGTFRVGAGDRLPFTLTWHRSWTPPPERIDPVGAVERTESWWAAWSSRCGYRAEWHGEVACSLTVLKALTYAPTGGIVAAPTTSLPEHLGGVRNWDYRHCWLRDATYTLLALMDAGFEEDARAWRNWLLRAMAGAPKQLQIMYGIRGERQVPERELPWLPGHEGSSPVRIGNAAAEQLQLDVFGEVMDCLGQARGMGLDGDPDVWAMQRGLMDLLEGRWQDADTGLWEVRGQPRHFTHSKVMAWVAFDRAVTDAERWGLDGPVDRWRRQRDEIREEVLAKAWDDDQHTFTQSYGSPHLDASLLLMPAVGFLPATDERFSSTVAAIERTLVQDGFVLRYDTSTNECDGLPEGEGAFLPCSFWLVDAYAALGRRDDALALFDRVRGTANDVGLFPEQWDGAGGRALGNFPQAWSHEAFVSSAMNLAVGDRTPRRQRAR